jgi:hypothetical protein
MDDAFAGGVCRCQHCGTIMTVPAQLRKGGTAAALAGATAAKTLYRRKSRASAGQTGAGTGLDDLADIVASSGLASGRLRAGAPAGSKSRTSLLLAICGVLIVALVGAVIYLVTRGGGEGAQASQQPLAGLDGGVPGAPSAKSAPAAAGPNFCGVPLAGRTIVYVLDRGDSTRDVFGDLKLATYKSIGSLGVDHRFQVVFWDSGGSVEAYPIAGATFATRDNLDVCKRLLDDIAPHGKTEVGPALKKAFAANPTDIVIATAKGWDLDDTFVNAVETAKQENRSAAKIHTVSVGDPGSNTSLRTVSQRGKGQYKVVSAAELQAFGQ